MSGSAEDLGIWKKNSWDLNSEWVSWDSSLVEGSQLVVSSRQDQLGSTKCAARLLKKLCLSLLMSKNLKLKKVIKSFVPEPKESRQVFPDSYMRMNIMNVLCMWIFWPYFWTYIYATALFYYSWKHSSKYYFVW